MTEHYVNVVAPREGVNDDAAHVLRWLVPDGERVNADQPVVILETTKATFDVVSPIAGHVFHVVPAGSQVAIGSTIAVVSITGERPREADLGSPRGSGAEPAGQVISKRARELIARHGLPLSHFATLAAVREADVAAVIQEMSSKEAPANSRVGVETPADAPPDPDSDLTSAEYRQIQELLGALRRQMRARFHRHVPAGTLLHDRWTLARDWGFGDGTSVYDECLILGKVTVGKHCWIGPFTILDGSQGELTIGDYVDIGSGTHVYTHNTIERALTGHRAPIFGNSTTIGSCCFIAPNVAIAAGTVLGDHCFVAAGSYVEGTYRSHSYIAGNPAKVVGTVEISGNRAIVRRFAAKP